MYEGDHWQLAEKWARTSNKIVVDYLTAAGNNKSGWQMMEWAEVAITITNHQQEWQRQVKAGNENNRTAAGYSCQ